MHNRTFWVDQVEDQDGQVIQQGTLIDQAHLNNMEVGISDIHLAYRIIQNVVLWFGRRLGVLETSSNSHDTDIASIKSTDTTQNSRLSAVESEIAAEVKEVTLTANSNPWPFCTKETAVALTTTRKNTNYDVDVAVKSYSGGRLGDICWAEENVIGSKMGEEKKKQVIKALRDLTPDWLDWAINEKFLDFFVELIFKVTKSKLEAYMEKKSKETATVARFGKAGEDKHND